MWIGWAVYVGGVLASWMALTYGSSYMHAYYDYYECMSTVKEGYEYRCEDRYYDVLEQW